MCCKAVLMKLLKAGLSSEAEWLWVPAVTEMLWTIRSHQNLYLTCILVTVAWCSKVDHRAFTVFFQLNWAHGPLLLHYPFIIDTNLCHWNLLVPISSSHWTKAGHQSNAQHTHWLFTLSHQIQCHKCPDEYANVTFILWDHTTTHCATMWPFIMYSMFWKWRWNFPFSGLFFAVFNLLESWRFSSNPCSLYFTVSLMKQHQEQ